MTTISNNPQVSLNIQKGIRQAEDDLVTWIQKALDDTKSYGKLEESQFRNLLRVAETTESPEVVKNFLYYQLGRDEKWGKGDNSLGKKIITQIANEIRQKAVKIKTDAQAEDLNPIWMQLIRLYLGYGSRYLKYLKEGKGP